MPTITGTDVTIRNTSARFTVDQYGPSNWFDGKLNDSYIYQYGNGNTALVTGDYNYLEQFQANGSGYAQGINYADMSGTGNTINTYGTALVRTNGDWTSGFFYGDTTLTAKGDNGYFYSGWGTFDAKVSGYSPYVFTNGPTNLQEKSDYADNYIFTNDGVGGDKSVVSLNGFSNWTTWKGDAAGNGGEPDKLNFTAGPGSKDTELWASGGNVTALLTEGSQSVINASGANSLTVVTFGDDVDFTLNTGNAATQVYRLEDLLTGVGYGYTKGGDNNQALVYSGASTGQLTNNIVPGSLITGGAFNLDTIAPMIGVVSSINRASAFTPNGG